MNLCSNNHDEVAFEGRKCPFCEALASTDKAIEQYKDEIVSLQDQLGDAVNTAKQLHEELDNLLKPCLEAANGVRK